MSVQVPKGYKQTEVGVIPEDWECQILDELAKRGSGHTPNKKIPEYWNGPIKWISLRDSDVLDKLFIEDTAVKISKKGLNNSSAVLHPAGTVVLSRDAGVGKSAIMKYEMAVSQHFMAWQCKSYLNNKFLYFYLQAKKNEFERIAMGSTIKTIGLPYFKDLKIPKPSIEEQQAIAEALSDADALIEWLEQLRTKKRQIKQGVMQELLTGQRRLPGFSGEWKSCSLLQLAENKKEFFDDGDWIESEHIIDQGIRIIQTGNIGVGEFVEKEEKKYISEKSFTDLGCKKVEIGDLLICRLAEPAGRACVLQDIGEKKIVTSVDVSIFRAPLSVANRDFLSILFSSDNWFKLVSDRSGGTTHKRISRGALGNIKIKLPELAEQEAIASMFCTIDSEIQVLESKAFKARQIKQAMMQELLTGRIRLI